MMGFLCLVLMFCNVNKYFFFLFHRILREKDYKYFLQYCCSKCAQRMQGNCSERKQHCGGCIIHSEKYADGKLEENAIPPEGFNLA